jgi:hypothetical protein
MAETGRAGTTELKTGCALQGRRFGSFGRGHALPRIDLYQVTVRAPSPSHAQAGGERVAGILSREVALVAEAERRRLGHRSVGGKSENDAVALRRDAVGREGIGRCAGVLQGRPPSISCTWPVT